MIPYKIRGFNRKTSQTEELTIGLFSPSKEIDDKLTSDNIAFYFSNIGKCVVPLFGESGEYCVLGVSSSDEALGEVVVSKKKCILLSVYWGFPVLAEHCQIKYPFKFICNLTFHEATGNFEFDVMEKAPFLCTAPRDAIFNEGFVKKVLDYSGVDISSLKDKYGQRDYCNDETPLANINPIEGYVKACSQSKEFRECIEKGIKSAYEWVFHTMPTIKKKAKAALTAYKDNSIDTLPEFVRKYISENIAKDGEKNIVSLYSLGFTEADFKAYKRIFKNFGNVGYGRYTDFDKFLKVNHDKPLDAFQVLDIIKFNTKPNAGCSVADFFSTFNSIQNAKKYENIDLENKFYESAVCGALPNDRGSFFTELNILRTKKKNEMLAQYPELVFPDNDFLPIKFKRIFNLKDFMINSFFRFKKNTILFLFSLRDKEMCLEIDLDSQSYKIYSLVQSSFGTQYTALLYGDGKKQGYFSQYMTDADIKIIDSMLSEYIFEKYLENKFTSVF